jgi:phosphatidate cytidylyltransferase
VFLVNAIAVVGTEEFCRLLEAKGQRPHRLLAIAAAMVLPWLAYWRGGAHVELGLVFLVLAILTAQLFRRRDDEALVHIATSILAVVYVGWLASFLVRVRELPLAAGLPYVHGFHALCFVLLVTWMADTGAYVIGSLFGRHKLAPHISPAKSIEGAVGGVLFAVAAGAVATPWLHGGVTVIGAAGLGALAAACGLAGDLVESRLKRDAHVKDSSSVIPGHGGALDRFDSVLFTTPLLYYVLRSFVW